MRQALQSVDAPPLERSGQRSDRCARIFGLTSFAELLTHEAVKEALLDMGKLGGMLDARDDLSAGPLGIPGH